MTRFYLASGLPNRDAVARIGRALVRAGLRWTFDWTREIHLATPAEQIPASEWERIADDEAFGVRLAEVVVVLLPGGIGTHWEFGMAHGMNKRIFLGRLSDAPAPCPFHHLPDVERLPDGEEAIIAKLLEVLS